MHRSQMELNATDPEMKEIAVTVNVAEQASVVENAPSPPPGMEAQMFVAPKEQSLTPEFPFLHQPQVRTTLVQHFRCLGLKYLQDGHGQDSPADFLVDFSLREALTKQSALKQKPE